MHSSTLKQSSDHGGLSFFNFHNCNLLVEEQKTQTFQFLNTCAQSLKSHMSCCPAESSFRLWLSCPGCNVSTVHMYLKPSPNYHLKQDYQIAIFYMLIAPMLNLLTTGTRKLKELYGVFWGNCILGHFQPGCQANSTCQHTSWEAMASLKTLLS